MLSKLQSEQKDFARFHVPAENMDNAQMIAERVAAAPLEAQSALRTTLSYLYLHDGPVNLRNPTFRLAESQLTHYEVILARYLKSRTGGVGRKDYGKEALLQMRAAGYKCECCGYGDVRTLQLDHLHGRTQKGLFGSVRKLPQHQVTALRLVGHQASRKWRLTTHSSGRRSIACASYKVCGAGAAKFRR